MIKVYNLKKSFQKIQILKGISTNFEKGKTNVIIGKSGSGKTVFIKCLLGLITPDSGKIFYEGIDSYNMNFKEKKKLRSKIGVVFQGNALFDSMNVEENVMFPLKMFTNKNLKEMKENVNQILEKVKLENCHKKYPSELSGGMQKRVAIARAIINNPNFLFCDEPNSGLDPKTSIIIDQLIQEITKEYIITTIINTHDINSIIEIGEKILFLKNGFKKWEGNSNEILTTSNDSIINFLYSSNLFRKIRSNFIKK